MRSRAAAVSLAAALTVLALKGAAYALSGSVALLSDAGESLVNVVSALTLALALRVSAAPPDYRHPYGHQKAEDVSGAFEAAMILLAAAAIAVSALRRLLAPEPLGPLGPALTVATVATLINGAAAAFLFRRARTLESAALAANARHLRTDVWTSLGVIGGVALVAVSGWRWLDPALALVVAANIVREGARVLQRALSQLLDERLPEAEEALIVAELRAHPEVRGFHRLRSRRSGSHRFAELDIFVEPELTVRQAHDLVVELEDRIHQQLPNLITTVHVEPFEAGRREGEVAPRDEFPD